MLLRARFWVLVWRRSIRHFKNSDTVEVKSIMTDKMYIRDLAVQCIIGTKPEERRKKQAIVINIVLECDLGRAGKTDKLEDTVNYKKLAEEISDFSGKSKFFLIEKLAAGIAGICLKREEVKAVTVTVDKPGALAKARSAAVEIRRRRAEGRRQTTDDPAALR